MKKLVISAIGKDRPGIAARVTKILFDAGCNLEDSAMTILENEFAILLIASVPTQMPLALFQTRLHRQARALGLVLHIKEMNVTRDKKTAPPRTAIVSASGTDQTGILYRISSVLARHRVNISDLTSRQIPGPRKTAIYTVMIEIALPPRLSLKKLRKELEAMARTMRLDIQVREISVENL